MQHCNVRKVELHLTFRKFKMKCLIRSLYITKRTRKGRFTTESMAQEVFISIIYHYFDELFPKTTFNCLNCESLVKLQSRRTSLAPYRLSGRGHVPGWRKFYSFKVQLSLFLVFVSNYLSYNIKHFWENVFDFGPIFLFPYYFEIRKVSSILVHWPRPEGDWR